MINQFILSSSKTDEIINEAIQSQTKEEVVRNALISSGAGIACLIAGGIILWKIKEKKSKNLSYLAWGLITVGGVVVATNLPKFF